MNKLEELNQLGQKEINDLFIEAAYQCNIEEMTYLLTKKGLKKKANINAKNDEALRRCCLNGKPDNQLQAVEFLLTSPLLKKHANLTENAFRGASAFGKSEVVKYLLESPDLKTNADVACDSYHALHAACKYDRFDLIDYYWNDLKLNPGKDWMEWLPRNIPDYDFDKAMKIIEAGKMADKLEIELDNKQNSKKNKI